MGVGSGECWVTAGLLPEAGKQVCGSGSAGRGWTHGAPKPCAHWSGGCVREGAAALSCLTSERGAFSLGQTGGRMRCMRSYTHRTRLIIGGVGRGRRPARSAPLLPRVTAPLRPSACPRTAVPPRLRPPQAMQLAAADAAARQGRLTALRAADDSDWWAVLHWAAMRLPAGRSADRFFDRLRLLPLSHHHRFPIYEQVRALQRRREGQE